MLLVFMRLARVLLRKETMTNETKKKHSETEPGDSLSRSFPGKLLFNLEEAGAVLGLSAWTVRDYVKAKKIRRAIVPHPFQQGKFLERPILIHADELRVFAARCNGQEKEDARVA